MAVVLDSDAVVGFLDRDDALHDEAALGGFFAELISAILPVDAPVADRSAQLRARFGSLRMPDALILASADSEAGVDLIITGDRQIAKVSGLSCTVRLLG